MKSTTLKKNTMIIYYFCEIIEIVGFCLQNREVIKIISYLEDGYKSLFLTFRLQGRWTPVYVFILLIADRLSISVQRGEDLASRRCSIHLSRKYFSLVFIQLFSMGTIVLLNLSISKWSHDLVIIFMSLEICSGTKVISDWKQDQAWH